VLSLARFLFGLFMKVGRDNRPAFEISSWRGSSFNRDRERLMSDNSHTDFSSSLVQMIRCPVTKSDLTVANEQIVSDLNQQIGDRKLLNQLGQVVEEPLESGFINQNGSLLLPVRGGIVILIADQAIPDQQAA